MAMAAVTTAFGGASTSTFTRNAVRNVGMPRESSSRVRVVIVSASSLKELRNVVGMVNKKLKKVMEEPAVRNSAFAVMNVLMTTLPAIAAEKSEKGKIFDFNLTLPIIMAEFLFLMVALDKIFFTPVGKFMDDRDEMIKQKLLSAREKNEQIKKLQDEAEALIKAAMAETAAALDKMKKETAAELDAEMQKQREQIEKELAEALANLEKQKQEALLNLESQIDELSAVIVKKVLPSNV